MTAKKVHRNRKLEYNIASVFSASLVTYPLNMNWILWSNGQSAQHTTVSSMEVLLWIRQHIWGIQETCSAGKSDCLHCPTTCTDRWEIYKKPWVGAQKNLIAFCWCCSGPCRHQGDWQSWAQFYHAPTWKSSWISYSGAQALREKERKLCWEKKKAVMEGWHFDSNWQHGHYK